MQAKTFTLITALVILTIVIEAIRRQKMTFKYSIFWLSSCFVVSTFAVNDRLLGRISDLAGFSLPSNFVFFLVLSFFMVLSLLLTVYVNEQNSRTETLAQTIAILDYKIQTLEKKFPHSPS